MAVSFLEFVFPSRMGPFRYGEVPAAWILRRLARGLRL
jgi:hypothetical protein